MVILTPSQPGFTTSSDPEESLENAEGWLQNNRYPSSDKRHWDNAAVMSGWSFTEDTLGLANLGECDNEKAVSISSFLGFDVATDTAAHEIGHNLGMCHDSFQNNCPPSGYIMAAETTDVRVKPKWSSCSKRYYNHFIASKDCYNDS
ncbi:zinc metalloproteinase/disintegrin-like [Acanthaster planci]|uniref:Zinc metalloproteinase/disintegrin-like n=1 Tax=Acanthaster planci TaxID=133434 RepID=A0A8B7Z883_ACAPL|nr:zinc metalloproteinase/disintegrin-like [Acanthaster planci]